MLSRNRVAAALVVVGALLVLIGVIAQAGEAQQSLQRESFSRCQSSGVTSVPIDVATSGNTELVALAAGETIHVCGFGFESDVAATTVQLVSGTGTACATSETDLTGQLTLLAGTPIAVANGGATQLKATSGHALCLELDAATDVNGWLTYYQE